MHTSETLPGESEACRPGSRGREPSESLLDRGPGADMGKRKRQSVAVTLIGMWAGPWSPPLGV